MPGTGSGGGMMTAGCGGEEAIVAARVGIYSFAAQVIPVLDMALFGFRRERGEGRMYSTVRTNPVHYI